MRTYLFTLTYLLTLLSNTIAQIPVSRDSCNCPPQYTHSEILRYNITFEKIVVPDSSKYSNLPSLINDLDILSNKINYPEIALRAGVTGETKYLIKINQEGKVQEIKIIRGIGAGLDEATISELKNLNFIPAKINEKPVDSEVQISFNFKINKTIDKPEYKFDEIEYEGNKGLVWYKLRITFTKDGSACLYEDTGSKIEESIGTISQYLYTKLNDFIISQCYNNFKEIYYHSVSDAPKTTITLKFNNETKTISTYGDEHTPIGWWAIKNLIIQIKEQIKWKIIKSESTIKKLPPKKEDSE